MRHVAGAVGLFVTAFFAVVAHADVQVCNGVERKVHLALVWVNPDDANAIPGTNEYGTPFTVQGWWGIQPKECTHINFDGAAMYYRLETDTYAENGRYYRNQWGTGPFTFTVVDGLFKHKGTDPDPPGARVEKFSKFGAFPVWGQGGVLVTMQVTATGIRERCSMSAGRASIETDCTQR